LLSVIDLTCALFNFSYQLSHPNKRDYIYAKRQNQDSTALMKGALVLFQGSKIGSFTEIYVFWVPSL